MDETALSRIDFWRTDGNDGSPYSNWTKVKVKTVSETSNFGTFTDTTPAGIW
jgi:hypothetical protein